MLADRPCVDLQEPHRIVCELLSACGSPRLRHALACSVAFSEWLRTRQETSGTRTIRSPSRAQPRPTSCPCIRGIRPSRTTPPCCAPSVADHFSRTTSAHRVPRPNVHRNSVPEVCGAEGHFPVHTPRRVLEARTGCRLDHAARRRQSAQCTHARPPFVERRPTGISSAVRPASPSSSSARVAAMYVPPLRTTHSFGAPDAESATTFPSAGSNFRIHGAQDPPSPTTSHSIRRT